MFELKLYACDCDKQEMFLISCQGKPSCFRMIVMVAKQTIILQKCKLLNACQTVFTGKAGDLECQEYLSSFEETLVRTYSIFISEPIAL